MWSLWKKRLTEKNDKIVALVDQDERLQEEISSLQDDQQKDLKEVQKEIDEKVKKAVQHSIGEIKLLQQGRCPECGSRVEVFLYTSICPVCGYSRRISPSCGKVVVHLQDGKSLECDRVFEAKDMSLLCVKEDVVVYKVMHDAVRYVEYCWTKQELEEIRKRRRQEEIRVCDWCTKEIPADSEDVQTVYAAIGAYQQRFFFCNEKCMEAFEKQYPTRVHRDCYEKDCDECDECIKRFDTVVEDML